MCRFEERRAMVSRVRGKRSGLPDRAGASRAGGSPVELAGAGRESTRVRGTRSRPAATVVSSILFVLSWLAPSGPTLACSCLPATNEALVERADLAVIAAPVASAPFHAPVAQGPLIPPEERITIFEVKRLIKGPITEPWMAAVHWTNPVSCGLVFETSGRYLLTFRHHAGARGRPLRIGLCSARRKR